MNKLLAGLGFGLFFAAAASSTNYTLQTYDIGTGGGTGSSTNYKLNGISGTQTGNSQNSANFTLKNGLANSSTSNEPPAPSFTNPSSYYDRLKIVLNTGNNAADTKYLIAISTNNFATTSYVQADHSVGSNQAIGNYQTYSTWGGASGFSVVGLSPATTYQVKVKALQGTYSGSGFGPTATAATVATSLSMSLSTTVNSTPPFPINFTNLTAGTVVTGSADARIGMSTNALNGGGVYVLSANGGLVSLLANTTIPSVSGDLASTSSGYGALVTATSQTAGGPFTSASPFNGTGTVIGALATSLQPIVTTPGQLTGGSATVRLLAKTSSITPSANDYSDTLTFTSAAAF